MKELKKSYLEIQKSQFIGLLYEVNSTIEAEVIINNLKIEPKQARHIVYAYRIGSLEKNYSDKEPNGTTRGLLDVIHFKNIDNVLIVVVRYFGGILLGAGPLTRAYTKTASYLFDKNNWFFKVYLLLLKKS